MSAPFFLTPPRYVSLMFVCVVPEDADGSPWGVELTRSRSSLTFVVNTPDCSGTGDFGKVLFNGAVDADSFDASSFSCRVDLRGIQSANHALADQIEDTFGVVHANVEVAQITARESGLYTIEVDVELGAVKRRVTLDATVQSQTTEDGEPLIRVRAGTQIRVRDWLPQGAEVIEPEHESEMLAVACDWTFVLARPTHERTRPSAH